MSDPATGDIYLIQKNIFKPEASIYKVNEMIILRTNDETNDLVR